LANFDAELAREFFQAFANTCGCNLHLNLLYGDNIHHIIEACFKGFGTCAGCCYPSLIPA
jgi:imidazoleglycerol-phosphate dehydratase